MALEIPIMKHPKDEHQNILADMIRDEMEFHKVEMFYVHDEYGHRYLITDVTTPGWMKN